LSASRRKWNGQSPTTERLPDHDHRSSVALSVAKEARVPLQNLPNLDHSHGVPRDVEVVVFIKLKLVHYHAFSP
jgi:hypothetical protein